MPITLSGQNIDRIDLVRATLTTEASITATSSATGNTCISTGKFTVENGGTFYVEVFTPYLTKGTTNLDVELFDGATAAAGAFLQTLTGHMTASDILGSGNHFQALVSLIAGTHNMTVTAFVDAGTGKFGAGTGATGQPPPAIIRVRSA